jgi:glycerol-3-phosphate acyltransferase PlsY
VLSLIVIVLVSYVIGSFSFSLWAGQLFRGIDLRRHGSGNLGATNVLRTLGWKVAVPVLLLDAAKGAAAVLFLSRLRLDGDGRVLVGMSPFWIAMIAGVAAIAGHMWTPFARFKGGKGVATAAGVFFSVAPLATVCCLGVFVLATALTRLVSLGSVLAALCLPAFLLMLGPNAETRGPLLAIAAPLVGLIVWKHRENIRRIVAGTESKLGAPRSDQARTG